MLAALARVSCNRNTVATSYLTIVAQRTVTQNLYHAWTGTGTVTPSHRHQEWGNVMSSNRHRHRHRHRIISHSQHSSCDSLERRLSFLFSQFSTRSHEFLNKLRPDCRACAALNLRRPRPETIDPRLSPSLLQPECQIGVNLVLHSTFPYRLLDFLLLSHDTCFVLYALWLVDATRQTRKDSPWMMMRISRIFNCSTIFPAGLTQPTLA